jgi:RNA polymerase sigma factor (sigma-70 family)
MRKRSRAELSILVEKCRQGDGKAWERLIEIISPLIFSICRSMKLTREESFDIFGQVCYLLLTHLDALRSPDKVLSYVATTARREIRAASRRSRFFEYVEDCGTHIPAAQSEVTPEKLYERSKDGELLMRAVASLPKRDYELIWSLFFDRQEPGYRNIAERLGIPVSSIGPTRARCLTKLLRILKRKGFKW